MNKYFILIITLVFVLIGACIYALHMYAPAYKYNVLMATNAIVALLSATSYLIVKKAVHDRPEAFVRAVYGASLLKMMISMFAILAYLVIDRANIHKASILVMVPIYFIYAGVEAVSLSKLARERK